MNCPTRDSNPDGVDGYNQNPPHLDPELITRRSPLVCGGKADGAYNLPLHVVALFIVLIQSILSCCFPLIVKRFPQLKVPHHFLFLSKHFGTGVLIATAFVHLLPTAFTSLTDPCLPEFWNKGYPAMAGLIAMASVFFVVVIEMVFSTMNGGAVGGCHGSVDYETLGDPSGGPGRTRSNSASSARLISSRRQVHRRSTSIGHQLRGMEASPEPSAGPSNDELEGTDESEESSVEDTPIEMRSLAGRKRSVSLTNQTHRHRNENGGHGLSEEQQQKKNLLQVLLLEAGILFHSVFIGMALSVATGSNFIVLLIAIVFHQTFEGLALGSRIAGITAFSKNSLRPWLMCLAYGTTTPIGQAIGLFTRNLYDPASQTGLLMVGTMNAISSGLLLFAGLVELLAEDFLSDESYSTLTGKRRIEACLAVAAGAAGMALVGAWA